MPADIVLKVDANTAAYIAKISQMADAHKKVGDQMGKQKDLSDVLTKGLGNTIFKAAALAQAVRTVTSSLMEASKAAEELNKKTGAGAIKTSSSLASLGFKGEELSNAMSVVNQDTGVATLDESAQFVDQLADANRKRKGEGKAALTKRQTFELLNAYKRGGSVALGDQGEFIEGFMKTAGSKTSAADYANKVAADRLGVSDGYGAIERGLAVSGDELNTEFEVRAFERQKELERRGLSAGGARARLATAQRDKLRLSNPIATGVQDLANTATLGLGDVYTQKVYESTEAARLEARRRTIANDSKHGE